MMENFQMPLDEDVLLYNSGGNIQTITSETLASLLNKDELLKSKSTLNLIKTPFNN